MKLGFLILASLWLPVRSAWAAATLAQVAADNTQALAAQDPEVPLDGGDPVQIVRGELVLGLGVVESSNESAVLISLRRVGGTALQAGDLVTLAPASSQVQEVVSDGVEVWITHPVHTYWAVGEAACVSRKDFTVGCGRIVDANPQRAKLQLAASTAWVVVGDFVRSASYEASVLVVDEAQGAVGFRQVKARPWQVGERACVVESGVELVCGTVVVSEAQMAVLRGESAVVGLPLRSRVRGRPHTSFVYQVAGDQSSMIVTHPFGTAWNQGDTICAQRDGFEIGCGKVSQVTLLAALVEMQSRSDAPVAVGDMVFLSGSGKGDRLKKRTAVAAATPTGEGADVKRDPTMHDYFEEPPARSDLKELGQPVDEGYPRFGSFSIGVNYVFPTARYDQALGRNFALGFEATLVSLPTGNGNLSGMGMGVVFSAFDHSWFKGLWANGGLGMWNLTGTAGGVSEKFSTLAFSGSVGWKWHWSSGLNFGFGLGLNYLLKAQPPTVNLGASNLLPTIRMEMGFAF